MNYGRFALTALAVSVLVAAPVRAERQKVAILEFEVAKGLDLDRTYFSDKVRGSVQDRAPQLFVMTRESTEMLLKQFGKTLAECTGECEVETGKKLGADFVVSGRIAKIGSRLALTMRLHATATGELLKTAEALGKDTDALVDAADGAVATLLGPLVGETTTAPAARPSATTPTAKGLLKIVSAPSGAKVSIDGDAAGTTPLSVKKDAGIYVVSIELPGYAAVSRQVDLAGGKTALVNEKLMQAAGWLEISVSPEAAAQSVRVTVDGAPAGGGKQGPYKIGRHVVRAEGAGYKPAEAQVDVENGTTAAVKLAIEPLPGKLLVSVNVEADCSSGQARARATPSEVARLEVAPGAVEVICSKEGFDDASAKVDVAPGKAAAVTLALQKTQLPGHGCAGGEECKKRCYELGNPDLKACASACSAGDSQSCYLLGSAFESDRSRVKKDAGEASKWYAKGTAIEELGCESSVAQSCRLMSVYYKFGSNGKVKDEDKSRSYDVKARKIVERECLAGELPSCASLAGYYQEGTGGLPKDASEARKLYAKALQGLLRDCANKQDWNLCETVGLYYHEGRGTDVDLAEARAYYDKACKLIGGPEESGKHWADPCDAAAKLR